MDIYNEPMTVVRCFSLSVIKTGAHCARPEEEGSVVQWVLGLPVRQSRGRLVRVESSTNHFSRLTNFVAFISNTLFSLETT